MFVVGDEVYSFDIDTATWNSLKPTDETILLSSNWRLGWYQGSTLTWNGNILQFGGCYDQPQQSTIINQLVMYNIANNSFTELGTVDKRIQTLSHVVAVCNRSDRKPVCFWLFAKFLQLPALFLLI